MGAPLVQIIVRDNNVDQALKALKKKMQREGTFREMKRRNHFEKPSEKRAREEAEAAAQARAARGLGRPHVKRVHRATGLMQALEIWNRRRNFLRRLSFLWQSR
jgi:small subunit ribosomal protein S21